MDSQKSWTLAPSGQQPPAPPKDLDDQCLVAGSIIGCQNQTLGETIAIVGTPFALHYQSDRVSGRVGANVVAVNHADALGGWSFNVHHTYDPAENVLFLGDGRRRSADLLGSPIQTSAGEFLIASEDGSEIYVFDNSGFHLRTLGGLTATTRYEFSYDVSRLITITDSSGNVTTGTVLVATRDPVTRRDLTYQTPVDASGRFYISTPNFAHLARPFEIEVYYSGRRDTDAGPASAVATVH